MALPTLLAGLVLSGAIPTADAQDKPPSRQIPVAVQVELEQLENRFELELVRDCDDERCTSIGCTYVAHTVADRPKSSSLPGLGEGAGPGSVEPQEFLTRARCQYAHETDLEAATIGALSRRLETKLSKGWLTVSVANQGLQPLPDAMGEPPADDEDDTGEADEEVVEADVVEEPPFTLGTAAKELWYELLPHAPWMVGLALFTFFATILIWAARRVGAPTFEERALLAELAAGGGGGPGGAADGTAEAVVEDEGLSEPEWVAQQHESWASRLAEMDPASPDAEVQAMVRELLRSGETALLATAVLRFPDTLPAAFPRGGELATAKLALAEFLKTADEDELPADADFFRSLNRHALAASVAAQQDARVVRSLREDFGATGLVDMVGRLPSRIGAILFALAPGVEQLEMARLLSPDQGMQLADQLLRSNRMSPEEAQSLFDALSDADVAAPQGLVDKRVSDRGAAFDAAGALSVLLPSLSSERVSQLFAAALQRTAGSLPSWTRGILTADMLLALSDESRADLFLAVDIEPLAAWLSIQDPSARGLALEGVPDTLRLSVQASSVFPSRQRQVALAAEGRTVLARGFGNQLARAGVSFEEVVGGGGAVPA